MKDFEDAKVKTQFINPPIPIRSFDWIAWFDGEEDSSFTGHGKTEEEAKNNLKDSIYF